MAVYSLKSHYSTVQVLSPTLVNPIVYATIQTAPSGVIASRPVQEAVFDAGQEGPELTNFANAIEEIMQNPAVIGATGAQTIDPNGLLADNVLFTVQYPAGDTSGSNVTAEATVPVGMLDFSDGQIGQASLANVEKIIADVYANLKSAAGG